MSEKNRKIKKHEKDDSLERDVDYTVSKKSFFGDRLKYLMFLLAFPDDRSRSIDLICLFILVEHFFDLKVVWLVFLLMVVKELLRFAYNLLAVLRSAWWENKFE